jgi:hypothetical protein
MTRDETVEALRREVANLEQLLVDLGRVTVQSMLDAARSRIDTLRVRAVLGRMDTRDDVNEVIEAAETAYRHARQRADRAADEGTDVRAAIEEGVRAARDDLRAAVELAEERVAAG